MKDAILDLPVFDTHNHLESSSSITATSFWDIAHYFWFARELYGIGYPEASLDIPEQERSEAFCKAFEAGRNTYWNRMVRTTLKDLWDIEIKSPADILAANERIAATGADPAWAETVCAKINLKHFSLCGSADNGVQNVADRVCETAWLPAKAPSEEALANSDNPGTLLQQHAEEQQRKIEAAMARGVRVFRLELPATCEVPDPKSAASDPLLKCSFMKHRVLEAINRRGGHVQVFIGMQKPGNGSNGARNGINGIQTKSFSLNDPNRITDMYPLVEMYPDTTFELVSAAELSALDIVQAARIFPNVCPGGLWWFNFRASTYRQNMLYRMEALPAPRCTLLASDARCIEWMYCKTLLVKQLLADFLEEEIRRGFTGKETALYTAREWLYDASARMYLPRD